MKIGIFGGSFNPPHRMHENIALYFIKNNILDKVIFVPTGSKYKYKSNLASDTDRFNMVKLITDKNPSLDVSDYEFKDKTVYTYETLDYFKELYPDDEIYFICGLDNLSYIDKWERGEYILRNYKILVIKRNTDDLDEVLERLKDYKDNIIVLDKDEDDISSTEIRNHVLESGNYLDEDVFEYIKTRKLYKEN